MYRLLFIFFFLNTFIYSESIVLKSGDIITGEIIDHDAISIKVKDLNGNKINTISKSDIHRVFYTSDLNLVRKALEREKLANKNIKDIPKDENQNRRINRETSIVKKKKTNKQILLMNKRIQNLERKIFNLQKKLKDMEGK